MIKIIICVVFAITSIFCVNITNDYHVSDSSPKSMSINAISGTSNTGNIFTNIRYFRIFNTSTGWNVIKNYYSSGLDYVVNGVVSDDVINFRTIDEYNRLSLDIQFNSLVQISPQTPFNLQLNAGVLYSVGNGTNITTQGSNPNVMFQVSSNGGSSWSTYWNVPYTYSNGLITFTFSTTGNYNLIRMQYNSYTNYNDKHFTFAFYGALFEQSVYDASYQEGYDYATTIVDENSASYEAGLVQGQSNANSIINENSASYQAGYTAGTNASGSLFNVFSAAISAPVNVLLTTFDFELLGVNVGTFILSLLTLGFIVVIIKLIL